MCEFGRLQTSSLLFWKAKSRIGEWVFSLELILEELKCQWNEAEDAVPCPILILFFPSKIKIAQQIFDPPVLFPCQDSYHRRRALCDWQVLVQSSRQIRHRHGHLGRGELWWVTFMRWRIGAEENTNMLWLESSFRKLHQIIWWVSFLCNNQWI